MKIQILHDRQGRIVGLGQVAPALRGAKVKRAAGLTARTGQALLELDLEGPLAKRPLSEIHGEYRVDLKTKTLARR